MVTASARRLGCGPPGPGPPGPPRLGLSRCPSPSDSGFVLDSFRFKLLKYYSTVAVTPTDDSIVRSGRRLPRPGSLLRVYRSTLIRDLVFGTFGEISEDSEARKLPVLRYAVDETDRGLVEDADSSKGVLSFSVAIS